MVPQRDQDCRPGLGGLNQVYGPTVPLPLFRASVATMITTVVEPEWYNHATNTDNSWFV